MGGFALRARPIGDAFVHRTINEHLVSTGHPLADVVGNGSAHAEAAVIQPVGVHSVSIDHVPEQLMFLKAPLGLSAIAQATTQP